MSEPVPSTQSTEESEDELASPTSPQQQRQSPRFAADDTYPAQPEMAVKQQRAAAAAAAVARFEQKPPPPTLEEVTQAKAVEASRDKLVKALVSSLG